MNLIYMNTCEFFSLIEVELLLSIYIIINAASDLMALMNRLWVSCSFRNTRSIHVSMSSEISTTIYIVKYTNPVLYLSMYSFGIYTCIVCGIYIYTDLLGYNKTCKKPQYFSRQIIQIAPIYVVRHWTDSTADPNRISCSFTIEQFVFLCCVYCVKSYDQIHKKMKRVLKSIDDNGINACRPREYLPFIFDGQP